MKNILEKFTKLSRLIISPGAHHIGFQSALHVRKNTRINYPDIGAVGELPRVYFEQKEYAVRNISVGGMCIIDEKEELGFDVGSIVSLRLVWGDCEAQVDARIVGAQLKRKHIHFIEGETSAIIFSNLSRLIQPGFLGQKFYQLQNHNNILEIGELWIGPTGESLQFPKDNNVSYFAKIVINEKMLIVDKKSMPYWDTTNIPINVSSLSDILIMLANLPNPTPRVRRLIEHMQTHYSADPSLGNKINDVA